MHINGFEIENFNVHNFPEGQKYSTCPLCSESRKKKTQKCVTIRWENGLAKCSHCGELIQLHTYKKTKSDNFKIPEWKNNTKLSSKVVKWFEKRKISQFVLRLMNISEGIEVMPDKKNWIEKNTVQFPYYRNGCLINIKYRSGDKNFKLYKDAERIPYNLDNIQGHEIIYCVEGEMDVLTVMETGIHNVTSPPNGFNLRGEINLNWLNNDVQHFLNAKKLILVFDNDEPGERGKSEFIRRFGAHKCFTVDLKGEKDANDFSMKYGTELLKKTLEEHIEIPLENISVYSDCKEQVRDFFLNGMPKGIVTDILPGLDKNFSVNLSHIILVTGIPSSGKSEIVDQMCIGYSLKYDYKVAFASIENKPNSLHYQKLIRKLNGYAPKEKKDFNKSYELCEDYAENHFYMIDLKDGYDLERVLLKAEELVYRKGIRILVVDPFNKVHYKGKVEYISGNRTNDYANTYLSKLDEFGRKFNILIFLVAHPIKMNKQENGKRAIPDFYDVKGGGEFYDMCHHGLVVHRDYDKELVLIRTLKVKFAHLGNNNEDAWFKYNINNGRLNDVIGDINGMDGYEIAWDNENWVSKKFKREKQLEIDTREWYEKDQSEFSEAPF